MKMLDFISIVAAAALLASCGGKQDAAREASDAPAQAVVNFNADSAYAHVKAQCDFGPRVPSTPAHEQCGAYLEAQLARYCDTVYTQHADLTTHDGKVLHATNYIGVINPDAEKRILLMAHWDCRPWADNDPDPAKRHMPVMGANDAASGVAVLLELARIMKQKRPGVGVDILLDDAEDWGTDSIDESWALGTQYWVHHTHVPYYAPMYGILLDMVGAKGATFYQEGFSVDAAPSLVESIWATAADAGYGKYFIAQKLGYVTDDHKPLIDNQIPCVDIVDMRQSPSGFFSGWHTTHDTLDNIDKGTLKAVGQTVANFIYSIEQ
jgi:aminopeptidase-like protein